MDNYIKTIINGLKAWVTSGLTRLEASMTKLSGNLDTLGSKITSLTSKVTKAQTTADNAKSAAATAQTTADSAKSAAATAQTTAQNVQNQFGTVVANASEAKTAASEAKTIAESKADRPVVFTDDGSGTLLNASEEQATLEEVYNALLAGVVYIKIGNLYSTPVGFFMQDGALSLTVSNVVTGENIRYEVYET